MRFSRRGFLPWRAAAPTATMNARPQLAGLSVLRRLVGRLHRAFLEARVLVRVDAGFASSEPFDFLENRPRLDCVVALPRTVSWSEPRAVIFVSPAGPPAAPVRANESYDAHKRRRGKRPPSPSPPHASPATWIR